MLAPIFLFEFFPSDSLDFGIVRYTPNTLNHDS